MITYISPRDGLDRDLRDQLGIIESRLVGHAHISPGISSADREILHASPNVFS